MNVFFWRIAGLASICLLVSQVMGQAVDANSDISRAMSAAPPSVTAGAEIVSTDDHGHRKELRSGANGWTCIVPDTSVPRHDAIEHHPACFDKFGLEWLDAYEAHRAPNPDHVGYSYMMQGGSSWSNTDPFAPSVPRGQSDYVRLPPHIMILNAKVADSSGFPSGQANPDTHKPFVMFGGTSYALLIIPLN
jgi:hypothetical protein